MSRLIVWMVVVLAACDTLAPIPPTFTPTWEFSAPTLQPTPFVPIVPPTTGPDYVGRNNPQAAAIPFDSELLPLVVESDDAEPPVQSVQLTVRDNLTLAGELYENSPLELEQRALLQRLPGVVLIASTRGEWETLPRQLRDAGFTVLVVAVNNTLGIDDTVAILRIFSKTASVNPGVIGVVGSGPGASLALPACAADLICDMLILLSPSDQNLLPSYMVNYNPRPMLVVASTEDVSAFTTAQLLQIEATGDFRIQPYNNAGRGTDMLHSQPELSTVIVQWLTERLSP